MACKPQYPCLALLLSGCAPAQEPRRIPPAADTAGSVGQLEPGPLVHCADPSQRESQGPLVEYTGSDWLLQEPYASPEGQFAGWGASVADLDGDGRLDLYLPEMFEGQVFLGQEDGTWRLNAGAIPFAPGAQGSVAADVDDDGDLDLLVPSGSTEILFLNDGAGSFESVDPTGLAGGTTQVSFGAAFADMDGDGDLDGIVGTHTDYGAGPPDPTEGILGWPSVLGENIGGGQFADRSDLLPASTNAGNPFVASWVDLDQDGRPDLHLGNDHGVELVSNRAWFNTGAGFEDRSEAVGLGVPMDAMGLGIGDLNDDGYPDLALSGWAEIVLLESAGDGSWYRSNAARGLVPDAERGQVVGWGTELADMDNDGDLDLVMAFGDMIPLADEPSSPPEQPDGLWLQQEDGQFIDVAPDWGWDDTNMARGVIVADLNGDGWLDLVKRELGAPARMHLSRCGDSAWAVVRLRQEGLNQHAVGAKVEIEVDGRVSRRWLLAGGTGMASSGPMELHFGLGEAELIDRLEVTWPDGEQSHFEDVEPRRVLVVSR